MSEEKEKESDTFHETENGELHHESLGIRLARLDEKMKMARTDIHIIKTILEKYVTKIEFWPIKVIVFGMAGLILSGVGAAIIALVIGRHP